MCASRFQRLERRHRLTPVLGHILMIGGVIKLKHRLIGRHHSIPVVLGQIFIILGELESAASKLISAFICSLEA